MGQCAKALVFYEKTLEIKQTYLPDAHSELVSSYNNIACIHHSMGEHSKALSFYEKALNIRQAHLPENHSDLAVSYNNIGRVYNDIGDYSQALSFFTAALELWKKTPLENHTSWATLYYLSAVPFYERALDIYQKVSPVNLRRLADAYSQLGTAYGNIEENSKAFSCFAKAVGVGLKQLFFQIFPVRTMFLKMTQLWRESGSIEN